jgi:competence protein ComGC
MKKIFIIILLIAIVALVTKPSEKKHQDKITDKVEQALGIEQTNNEEKTNISLQT